MTTWALLASGPSATAEQAELVRAAGVPLGVVGNAFQLAPWADFIAASDSGWWRKYPEAKQFALRYTMHTVPDVETVRVPSSGGICNSGVLALECAKRLGATRILLLGFDMHGTHFFGKYTNGLRNTNPQQRVAHHKQYKDWGYANRGLEVINCTPKSALTCFPVARLEDVLETGIPEPAADQAGQDRNVCEGLAA